VQREFRTSDGAQLVFEDAGSGPALLLLHGLSGTHADFAHVFDLPALRGVRRVVALDARGHGRSTNPGGRFSFRSCAHDVLSLLDHLGIDRVQAVGASLGGKTLLHVATLAPERVSSMVLVSATPRFPEATLTLLRAAAEAPHSAAEWSAMRAQHPQGDAQIEALWRVPAQLARDAEGHSFSAADLAKIRAKTLLVSGDRDPLYPLALALELYAGTSGSALYVVPEAGHLPIFGAEAAPFAERALRWLGVPSAEGRS